MPRKGSAKGHTPRKAAKKQPRRIAKKKSPGKGLSKKSVNSLEEREKRQHVALDAARMGVWEWDVTENAVTWSDNVHKIFGLTRDGFDGTFETYLNLIHPEDKNRVVASINSALNSKGYCHVEHRLTWPNGSTRWIETIGKVTSDKRGKPLKITGTIQDISIKKVIEFDREDWKTRHEMISSSAGIVIYDHDISSGNIIWSGNSQTVLGFKPSELGNIDRWLSLIHPKDRKQAVSELERTQETLQAYSVYYRFRKKQGGFVYIHDRGFFIADRRGTAARMLGMMADVSERIRAEKTIKENSQFRESLENAMPGILYVYDIVNKNLIHANRNISEYLGFTLPELRRLGNKFISTILHPEDLAKLTQWTDEPDGTVKESEQRILGKDGHYHTFLTRDTPFKRNEKGLVTQIIGIAQDITSRKEVVGRLHQSETSYRELFDTVGEAIYIQRSDETFLDVNKGACRMFGYDKKELIGATLSFLAAEGKNDFEEIRRRMHAAFEGTPQVFEFWGKKKNGEIFLQEIRFTRGSYFGKQIVIGTGWDITQRRQTELAAKESELRFRTLQQASFGGIGLHDEGFIIDCNQGLSDITGYPYSELIGRNGLELIAQEWRPFVLEKIKAGYDKPYDVEGLKKDGTKYALEIHGKNIPYHGRTIRVTEFRDITERKKTEEKIVEQNAKLQALTEDLVRKNNQLEEFTQIVSHNLRSPVGNITTLLSFFENAASDEERREYFSLLKESTATTLYMINEVNDVLKIKQHKNIEKQEMKFSSVLQKVITLLNAKISQLSASISADFSESPTLLYPAIYLESIFLNLLDNGLKYSHPERKPEIHFKTYSDRKGNVILEVKDNGLGLNLNKYGHYMFKLRKTFHRHPESRGIGLFMIKNQIETMGGDITLTSVENEGSTFYVNFSKHQADGV
jgi:PAS domain S-box-containing protein